MAQIAGTAALRNLTVADLMAIVEEEGWEYEGIEPKDGRAYVCSAFMAAMYQAAGLFGEGVRINGPEFTPRDVYTLNFFDLNFTKPEACQKDRPDVPYCQILGKFKSAHPGYSTVAPYDHMCEHCPTMAPGYERPNGC